MMTRARSGCPLGRRLGARAGPGGRGHHRASIPAEDTCPRSTTRCSAILAAPAPPRRSSRRSRMDASVVALLALALTAVTLPILVFALIPGLLIAKLARMQD